MKTAITIDDKVKQLEDRIARVERRVVDLDNLPAEIKQSSGVTQHFTVRCRSKKCCGKEIPKAEMRGGWDVIVVGDKSYALCTPCRKEIKDMLWEEHLV